MEICPPGVGFTLEDLTIRLLQRDRGLRITPPRVGEALSGATRRCHKCGGAGRYNIREERHEDGKILITVVGKQCEPCHGTGQITT